MISETIKIEITFTRKSFLFAMKMMTVEEEHQYTDRLLKVAEDKDPAKEYEFLVDQIKSWTVDKVIVKAEDESEEKDVHEIFEVRTAGTERLANVLLNAYRNAIMPKVDFL